MYSALSCPALASLPFFSAADHGKRIGTIHTRPPGLWVPVSLTPAEPWHRKVPETHGKRAKKLHLDEIYRSVPAMPPGTDRKAVKQKTRDAQTDDVLYISELAPRAWSGMTGVVDSLK